MKHKEYEMIGEKDFRIYYQSWLPDQDPKAIVQIFHGFGEHSGRYMNVVNELIPLNYGIYINDHRGHGKSDGTTNYVESFDLFIEDEKTFHDLIKKQHPDIPIFVLGHSMGSAIAIYFAEKYQELLQGLILSGTGIRLGEEISPFLKFMSKIMAKLAPKMKIDTKLNPESLSHDPVVVKNYKEDPLVHYQKITTRLGNEMLKRFRNLKEVLMNLELPLLVQVGSEDVAIQGIEELEGSFKMEDKTIKVYDGLYHEVYNEIKEEREKVLEDLVYLLENYI
jgi:alpha-beta hydrolase superfamily lysophospholipase